MNDIDLDKFRVPLYAVPKTKVIKLLDFPDYPVLTLEEDGVGSQYLSYLSEYKTVCIDKKQLEVEERHLIAVTQYTYIMCSVLGKITLKSCFDNPENGMVYMLYISERTGIREAAFIVPASEYINKITD